MIANQNSFEQCLMWGIQSQFFPKILLKQHDTGTRLAMPSCRHPFSKYNKGNRSCVCMQAKIGGILETIPFLWGGGGGEQYIF